MTSGTRTPMAGDRRHEPSGALAKRVDVAVVGAGIAGAATAYHLARRGGARAVLLEREPVAGYHATGRNAALAYTVIFEPMVMELAARSTAFLRNPPEDFPEPLHNSWNGSITLASGADVGRLEKVSEQLGRMNIPVEHLDPADVKERVPIIRPETFQKGIWCPSDGVMDIHAMLQGYLKGARRGGISIRTRCPVNAIQTRSGRVTGLCTEQGTITADKVVLAAGPWSNELAATADLTPLPLAVCRRHLLNLDIGSTVPAHWPFVWDITRAFYFRPEGKHLLFSPCDQDEMKPHDSGVDWAMVELGAEQALTWLNGLDGAQVVNAWSGLRTLTPDNLFVLGPDPRLDGLYWAAGLCGHGMTTSWAVGQLTAELVLEGDARTADVAPFSPERFMG